MNFGRLRYLYAPEYLVKESLKCGEIPNTKSAYSLALRIAWPSIVEYLLISLVMMADTVMVGLVGPAAIAAVGITVQPRFIVQAAALALNVGVAAVVARRFGENNKDSASSCLKQGLIISFLISACLSAIAFVFSRQLISFAGAKADSIEYSLAYFKIILIALPFNSASLTISSALRGIGQTRLSMRISILSNVFNVGLNYLLIGGNFGFPELGVTGAAIATAIGWTIALIYALVVAFNPNGYFCLSEKKGWMFERKVLKPIYQVSSGAFIEQLFMRMGFLAFNIIVARLGTNQYATHIICVNILSLSFAMGEGMGIAASTLVGQNLGAKRPDLSLVYAKALQRISIIYGILLMFLFVIFGRNMLMLFSNIPEILDTGERILIIGGILCIGQASQMIFMGSLRGAGDTMYVAIISSISIVLMRPAVAYFLAYPMGLGLYGAWTSFMLDQIFRLIATYIRFTSGKWINIKL